MSSASADLAHAGPVADEAWHDTRRMSDSERDPPASDEPVELSIVMPCLNEVRTLEACIVSARSFLARTGIRGEIIVADNGSTDGSQALATLTGARVVSIPERGYGAALLGGIRSARGTFVVMGDADQSYDFSRLDEFVSQLRSGVDLVMGNRFQGGVLPNAMPPLHRYLGNPVLSSIGRLLFRSPVRDFHCGLRAFRRSSILSLTLSSKGMEFASEMVVRASLAGLRMSEVPTTLAPDGRDRPPHLRSWRDGWRHLRLLLLMSPRWLLLYPGLATLSIGFFLQALIGYGPLRIGGIGLDVHSMLYATALSLLGLQMILFSVIARAIGLVRGLLPLTPRFATLVNAFTLERGVCLGLLVGTIGMGLAIQTVLMWTSTGLSSLDPVIVMRVAIPAVGFMLGGAEILFASFVLGLVDPGASEDER